MNNQNENTKKGYIEESFDIFDYKNLGQVRTHIEGIEKWFCLNDICKILDIKSPWNVVSRIDDPYIHRTEVGVQTGIKADGTPAIQNVSMVFVNESGLYQAIGNSRKPEAKEFMNWIYDDVLPTLNSKGYYIMDNKPKDEVIRDLQSKVNNLENKMANIDNGIKSLEYVTNNTYMRISAYARYRHLGINLSMAIYLGRMASKISIERDVPVFSEPHEEFGTIRIYRADILKFVFDSFYNDADITYGDCE